MRPSPQAVHAGKTPVVFVVRLQQKRGEVMGLKARVTEPSRRLFAMHRSPRTPWGGVAPPAPQSLTNRKLAMKAQLIALAAVAACGAAAAQSSVTVYGIADVFVGSVKNETNLDTTPTKASNGVVNSGGLSSSRLGFKGTEDLGGGLKAKFQIETSVKFDAPEASKLGDREAWVGLAGNFGEVQLGSPNNAYDDVHDMSKSGFKSIFSAMDNVFVTNKAGTEAENGLKYITPNFGGFEAALSYSFGENKTATTKADSTLALGVKYKTGPFAVALGHFQHKDAVAAAGASIFKVGPAGNNQKSTATNLNATYDFGVAKLKGTIANGKVTTDAQPDVKINEYEIGLDVPVTTALSVSVGYGQSKQKIAGVLDAKTSGYGVTALYTLSKRTAVYAGLATASEKDGAGVKTDKATKYGVGIRHNF